MIWLKTLVITLIIAIKVGVSLSSEGSVCGDSVFNTPVCCSTFDSNASFKELYGK